MNSTVETAKDKIETKSAPADALVFFGATGDLAHKKIFPAFPALAAAIFRPPDISCQSRVAKLDQLKAPARDSIERMAVFNSNAFGH
jgi:glucose-6-phosphate 1-dehydrogenase